MGNSCCYCGDSTLCDTFVTILVARRRLPPSPRLAKLSRMYWVLASRTPRALFYFGGEMRHVIAALLGVSVLSITASGALAAGSHSPAAAYDWSGFYVGGNAGADWQRGSFVSDNVSCFTLGCGTGLSHLGTVPEEAALGTSTNTRTGFTFGGLAGYNWQMNALVFGVEADLNYLGGTPSNGGNIVIGGTPITLINSANARWLATARGRVGYASDRTLLYVTGGAAFTHVKYSQSYSDNLGPGATTPFMTTSASATKTGYALGGGAEYALTDNWLVRAEYLYAGGFGSVGVAYLATAETGNSDFHSGSVKLSVQAARVGLSYKFH